MGKDKCPDCPPTGAPDWMVTYGDLMTLLLCFFVLLFSFSSMDKIMFESLKESFVGAFGMLQGHNAMEGKGISKQTQKWSSKLFDNAVEKVLKAKSDKFPFEQIVYLNSMIQQAEDAIGLIDEEIEKIKSTVSLDNLEYISETVKEKTKDSDVEKSKKKVETQR